MLQRSISSLKIFVFIVCLWPLFSVSYAIFYNNLGANPIEYIEKHFGFWALIFLCITLALTPLKLITNSKKWILLRRMLGLFVFFYTSLHLLIYLGLDYQFAWSDIKDDVVKHKYILVGFLAWILLIPLAITSSNKMISRLKKRWKKIHQLIYVIAILAILHFFWLVKKDMTEPIIFASIITILLAVRIYFYFANSKKSMKNLSMKAKHVLYDGKCGLCNKEIAYYRSIAPNDKFKWVDITIEKNLARYPLINLRDALMSLHVVEEQQIKTGVDAFITIWSELGNFKILAFFIRLPIVYQLASIFYRLFAKYRFKNLPHCQIIGK